MNPGEVKDKALIKQMDIEGFSLIELVVVMGLLGIVLAITISNFTTLLSAFKGESKIAETETETIVGLEILRQDIEHAGYGLPWFVSDINKNGNFSDDWSNINGYSEAGDQKVCNTTNNITTYNDAPNKAPRAILSGNNVCSDGSDYLVIKSTVVRNENESQKWTYLWNNGGTIQINLWPVANENMEGTTKVIAINSKQNKFDNVLVTYGSSNSFYSQLSNAVSNYSPKPSEVFLLFGIGRDTQLRMPFNRADYYLRDTDSSGKNIVPPRCAQGTKVLEKAIISHSNGQLSDYSPLLDCVADMQVIYRLDTNGDGIIDQTTADITALDAQAIRNRVKEVRVYILAQEGQYDKNYKFKNFTGTTCPSGKCIRVGEFGLGRDFDLTRIPNYQNYRWKVYTLIVLPDNLKGR